MRPAIVAIALTPKRTDMRRLFLCILAAVLFAWPSVSSAQVFNDHLIQPPELPPPGPGSITGSLANYELGDGGLVQGVFELPSPFVAPDERGSPPEQLFPIYSPHNGLSEWGMGWQSSLSIRRHRLLGEIDYRTDGFAGPWGRLFEGEDGYWYPSNLKARARHEQTGEGWRVILPDGTEYQFHQAEVSERGVFAWHLTRVHTIFGDGAEIEWRTNSSGRPFVEHVLYGERGDIGVNRIKFSYEELSQPLIDFRRGEASALDQRVDEILFERRNGGEGYSERWRYDIGYLDDPHGPSFFPRTVTRTFASGESEPPITYTYRLAEDWLTEATLEPIPGLDEYLSAVGTAGLQPNQVAYLDLERDGVPELEDHTQQHLIRNVQGVWKLFSPPPWPSNEDLDRRCRPEPNALNTPRSFAQLLRSYNAPQVVALDIGGPVTAPTTDVIACDRDGTVIAQTVIDGRFRPDPNNRIVDLDKDMQSDLITVLPGFLLIYKNESKGSVLSFSEARRQILSPGFAPRASWFRDVNGDAIVDVVAASNNGLAVWFGLGNMKFKERAEFYAIKNSDGSSPSSLQNFGIHFFDLNGDRLDDLLLVTSEGVFAFSNEGCNFLASAECAFREVRIPALNEKLSLHGEPAIGDYRGDGGTDVVYVSADGGGSLAHGLPISHPDMSLIVAVDDGKGNVLSFDYARAPPAEGVRTAPVVLDRVTRRASGEESISRTYSFKEPHVHSEGRHLVGFDKVQSWTETKSEDRYFLNEDDFSGILRDSSLQDRRHPDLVRWQTIGFEETTFQGVPFVRAKDIKEGWADNSGDRQLTVRTELLSYKKSFCASEISRTSVHGTLTTESEDFAEPTFLADGLYCLPQRETLRGEHPNQELDFEYVVERPRNDYGQVESISQIAGSEQRMLQDPIYDELGRLRAVISPGQGTSTVEYIDGTSVVEGVIEPSGVFHAVLERDPATDSILRLGTGLGEDTVHAVDFRFDGQERLWRSWRNFGGSSEDFPEQELTYRFGTHSAPGSIQITRVVDSESDARRSDIELFSGSGKSITSLAQFPAGWTLAAPLERVDPEARRKSSFWRSPLSTSSVRGLEFEGLFMGLDELSVETVDAFGGTSAVRNRVASDLEAGILQRRVTSKRALSDEGLVEVTTENDKLERHRVFSADGLLKSFTDEAGYTTAYEYDALGRLVRITLPDGTTHTQSFDEFGRKKRVARDYVGAIEFDYYPASGLVRTESHFGNDGLLYRMVEFAYDEIGRIETRTHSLPSGEVETFQYTYDGEHTTPPVQGQLGFLSRITNEDWSQTTTFNLDGTAKHVLVEFDDWRSLEVSFRYFANGETRQTEYQLFASNHSELLASLTERFELDDWGRLHKIYYNEKLLAELQYDDEGRMRSSILPEGGAISLGYHSPTQALIGYRIETKAISGAIGWAKNARDLIEWEEIIIGKELWRKEYLYHPRGFLRSVTKGDETESYRFDEMGRPTFMKDLAGERSIERNITEWAAGDLEYTLDAMGRVVARAGTQLRYGADGQVAEVTSPEGPTWEYVYDDAGNRVLWKKGGAAVKNAWGELTVLNDSLILPVRVGGVLVGIVDQDAFLPLLTDARDSVVLEPGNYLPSSAFGGRAVRPSISNIVEFSRAAFEPVLEAYRIGVRDYDPLIGHWFSPDPLFLAELEMALMEPHQADLYSFAVNDPLNFKDNDGQRASIIQSLLWPSLEGDSRDFDLVADLAPVSDVFTATQPAFSIELFNENLGDILFNRGYRIDTRLKLRQLTRLRLDGSFAEMGNQHFSTKWAFNRPTSGALSLGSKFLGIAAYPLAVASMENNARLYRQGEIGESRWAIRMIGDLVPLAGFVTVPIEIFYDATTKLERGQPYQGRRHIPCMACYRYSPSQRDVGVFEGTFKP